MCRIAAYLGPPLPLAELLYAPSHSLEKQSYLPREMVSGHVNVDGTGVAWWPAGESEPLRYVTERPPWSDPNLPRLAPRLHGETIVATVRSATPGIAAGAGAVLPFVHGTIAGSHNGWLGAFREATCGAALALLPSDLVGGLETITDSALLFLLAVDSWRRDPDLGRAAAAAVTTAAALCERAGADASLNLVLARAGEIAAVRHALGVPANPLYVRNSEGNAWWLASEPLDDGDWQPLPAGELARIDAAGLRTEALQAVAGEVER